MQQPPVKKVMIFIDGGYLRQGVKDLLNTNTINYQKLTSFLIDFLPGGAPAYDVVRSYYYDANIEPDKNNRMFVELDTYMQKVESCDFYEVKLGRLVRAGNTHHQKGVDVLLAVDMVRKAAMGQFDVAVLVAGDGDLAPAVAAAKGAGKTVLGVSFAGTLSTQLKNEFDISRHFTADTLKSRGIV
jgi:uncharacterized LabA/DUF88 family protein